MWYDIVTKSKGERNNDISADKFGEVQEKDLRYCHPNYKLRGLNATEIKPDDKAMLFSLNLRGVEIDGYPVLVREMREK